MIETVPGGHRLRAEPTAIDVCQFERLVTLGRASSRAGDFETAITLFDEALMISRGQPGADLHGDRARHLAARLEELHLATLEDRREARLRCRRDGELTRELATLVHAHPFRQRLRALHMIALYQARRQAEALEAHRATSDHLLDPLLDALAIDPGPELPALEVAILNQRPSLWDELPGGGGGADEGARRRASNRRRCGSSGPVMFRPCWCFPAAIISSSVVNPPRLGAVPDTRFDRRGKPQPSPCGDPPTWCIVCVDRPRVYERHVGERSADRRTRRGSG